MSIERAQYLIKQYLDADITNEELRELTRLLKDDTSSAELRAVLETFAAETGEMPLYREEDWEGMYKRIMTRAGESPVTRRAGKLAAFHARRRMAAAVLLFLIAGAVLLWQHSGNRREAVLPVDVAMIHDAAPGSSKAILTLADGRMVPLDSVHSGVLGIQGNERIISRNEQLVYQATGEAGPGSGGEGGSGARKEAGEEVSYNILTTPRGGQYKLVLPDGTKVWLDADTWLRYPTDFAGDRREVELRGEAYFEVAANAAAPFRVKVLRGTADPLEVDVLGTHFNIMDYGDEPAIRTTLLEGAVRVWKGAEGALLKPGQEARLGTDGRLVVSAADVEAAVAWKNGMFKFNGASIGQVMRQLSRWYDLDVEYVNGIPKDIFQGEMYRDVRASEILKILEASGVHFTVEGKKLLVK